MTTRPIVPARIRFAPGDAPFSLDCNDRYHPQVGALVQARHVFLGGNRLPQRWQGRDDFTVIETGFGLGNNFLATWDAWARDPARCRRLHYVSLDLHPPRRDDLQRALADSALPSLAAQLLDAWPPLTPNLHALDFAAGRVRLLIGFGDVADLLPELDCHGDAFFLDGFVPTHNPQMWDTRVLKALARRALPGATAASWSAARPLREALTAVGFEVELAAGTGTGSQLDITVARFAPRFTPRTGRRGGPAVAAPVQRTAVIVGAGLAGASTAAALCALGWQVTVLDRQAQPAAETSGNPAGLFHGTVHRDDGVHARLFRAAALQVQHTLRPLMAKAVVDGALDGLLRSETTLPLEAMQSLQRNQGLPPDFVQVLDPAQASARAGLALRHPAWYYPGGGWVSPASLVRHWLAAEGIRFVGHTPVARIDVDAGLWRCHDATGRCVAAAPVLVLANAADAQRLLPPQPGPAWALRLTRGQVSGWAGAVGASASLLRPVAGDGYVIPRSDGGLWCGATQSADSDPNVRAEDHHANFERVQRLTGVVAPDDPTRWQGRVGWRVQAADRLPIIGAVSASTLDFDHRLDQVALVPRTAGLFVATAFGGRGLTLSALCGRVLAAQIAGTPVPLERSLGNAIDPVRWLVRQVRAAS